MNIITKKERGQGLVEFAISITFIIILLVGMIDLGRAFFSFVALRDAAQEGAIYGSIFPIVDSNGNGKYDSGESLNTSDIVARVRGTSNTPVDLSDTAAVSVNVNVNGDPCQGHALTVSVSYNYQISMPMMGAILGRNTIPLTASVTNTILWPECP